MRSWAYYYQVIKHPIALDVMRRKIEKMEYGCVVSKFEADFTLMVENARQFNEAGTPVADAAEALLVAMKRAVAEVRKELAGDVPAS